jgi:hypothetical protein
VEVKRACFLGLDSNQQSSGWREEKRRQSLAMIRRSLVHQRARKRQRHVVDWRSIGFSEIRARQRIDNGDLKEAAGAATRFTAGDIELFSEILVCTQTESR